MACLIHEMGKLEKKFACCTADYVGVGTLFDI